MLFRSIAAVASAFTGRSKPVGGPGSTPESLGSELAAVAGEGAFEPAELVIPDSVEDSSETADKPGISG